MFEGLIFDVEGTLGDSRFKAAPVHHTRRILGPLQLLREVKRLTRARLP